MVPSIVRSDLEVKRSELEILQEKSDLSELL